MKRVLIIAVILALVMTVCPQFCSLTAQEEEDKTEYSFGTIKSITSTQIVVSEYDYENYEEVDVIFIIGPDVEYEGVDSYKDIAVGDSVEIDYVIKDGKNIAILIAVEKPSGEEEGLIIED